MTTTEVVPHPTPEMWQNVNSTRLDSHPTRKPPYTLIELIGMAILAHTEQAPTVGEIYEWVSNKFVYYNQGDTGWKNSIRHTLSIKDHFIQAGHPQTSIAGGGRTGRKSKTWKIDQRFRDHFRLEQVVEEGTTIWKLKYVPSKVGNKMGGGSSALIGDGGAHAARMQDMNPRKAGNKVRKGASAHKRALETVSENVPLSVGASMPYAPSGIPVGMPVMHAGAVGVMGTMQQPIQAYMFQSPILSPCEPERGLINFPSVMKELGQSDINDDHDDQKLVYLPRYDKRPRRKASLAACDVLTSLSTRIQSTYQ